MWNRCIIDFLDDSIKYIIIIMNNVFSTGAGLNFDQKKFL